MFTYFESVHKAYRSISTTNYLLIYKTIKSMKNLLILFSFALFTFSSCSKDKNGPLDDGGGSSDIPCELSFKVTQPETINFNKCWGIQGIYSSEATGLSLIMVTGESELDMTLTFSHNGNGNHLELNKPYQLISFLKYDEIANSEDFHGFIAGSGESLFDGKKYGSNTVQGTITYTSRQNDIYKGVFNFEAVETVNGEDIPESILKVVDGSFTSWIVHL